MLIVAVHLSFHNTSLFLSAGKDYYRFDEYKKMCGNQQCTSIGQAARGYPRNRIFFLRGLAGRKLDAAVQMDGHSLLFQGSNVFNFKYRVSFYLAASVVFSELQHQEIIGVSYNYSIS